VFVVHKVGDGIFAFNGSGSGDGPGLQKDLFAQQGLSAAGVSCNDEVTVVDRFSHNSSFFFVFFQVACFHDFGLIIADVFQFFKGEFQKKSKKMTERSFFFIFRPAAA
jgi:hypothetical protein